VVNYIRGARRLEDLFQIKSLHYEKKKGDLNGVDAVWINDHCLSQKFMSIANTQYTKEELKVIYPSSKQKKDNLLRSLDNQLIASVNSNSTKAEKKSAATLKLQWEKKDRRNEYGARALHWLNENHIYLW